MPGSLIISVSLHTLKSMNSKIRISPVIVLAVVSFLIASCNKEEHVKLPVVSTDPVTNMTITTAVSGGKITSDGGAEITSRGVCLSLTSNPTTSDKKTIDGSGTGQFESTITELDTGATYYLRAYATNSAGTAYGLEIVFSTLGDDPAVTTIGATNLSQIGAQLNGIINANYLLSTVTFEFGTTTDYGSTSTATQSPVIGNTDNVVSVNVAGLLPATNYHFRVNAANSLGTSYGSDLSFTTLESISVTDADGNIYIAVTIGTQVWMAENLRTTKYNDNSDIPLVTDYTAWAGLTTPAYCWYDNSESTNKLPYGALYTWYVVDPASNGGKNVCPVGWHVPGYSEWSVLINYLGRERVAGGKLKESGTTHWNPPNTGATNETGFTALPGGYRFGDVKFYEIGNNGIWWSSSKYSSSLAYFWEMSNGYTGVGYGIGGKEFGYSIRCVRDF